VFSVSQASSANGNTDDLSSSSDGPLSDTKKEEDSSAQPSPAPSLGKKSFAERMLAKMGWKAGEGSCIG